jgi:hypothetical protein
MAERCTGGAGFCAVIPEFLAICDKRETNISRLAKRTGYSRGYVISLILAAKSDIGVTRVQVERMKEVITAHELLEKIRA